MEKILGNFVIAEKWEPWLNEPGQINVLPLIMYYFTVKLRRDTFMLFSTKGKYPRTQN